MTADELRQRRLALNVPRGRFALLLGVTPATLGMWERGKAPIPDYLEARLAEIERTRWPKREGQQT